MKLSETFDFLFLMTMVTLNLSNMPNLFLDVTLKLATRKEERMAYPQVIDVLVKQQFYTKWVILSVSELGKCLINFVEFSFKLHSENLLFNYIFRYFKSYVPVKKL